MSKDFRFITENGNILIPNRNKWDGLFKKISYKKNNEGLPVDMSGNKIKGTLWTKESIIKKDYHPILVNIEGINYRAIAITSPDIIATYNSQTKAGIKSIEFLDKPPTELKQYAFTIAVNVMECINYHCKLSNTFIDGTSFKPLMAKKLVSSLINRNTNNKIEEILSGI